MKIPAKLVKQSLEGHSWLGLLIGAFMYFICLTGTLSVFSPELKRWETANVRESLFLDIFSVERAINTIVTDAQMVTDHIYAYLPAEDMPRALVSSEQQDWLINLDGSLSVYKNAKWTGLLTNLHIYLTIPGSLGIILVSSIGALLCALIISGFLAHPNLVKEAFKLRFGGEDRIESVDMHNRLSVWGAPFHLTIAITGAYFGLVLPMLGIVSAVANLNATEIQASVFGEDPPVINSANGEFKIAKALDHLQSIDPKVEPFRLIIHNAGTDNQFLDILARHPGRLIYSETYHYSPDGNYLGKVGFSDGYAGQQIVYSVYDLHFGSFAGMFSKAVYFLLGISLTIVSASGINVWIRKRKYENAVNDIWLGVLWGLPLTLIMTAALELTLGATSIPLFWSLLTVILAYCAYRKSSKLCERHLKIANLWSSLTLIIIHISVFGRVAFADASLLINLLILGYALSMLLLLKRNKASRALAEGEINAAKRRHLEL